MIKHKRGYWLCMGLLVGLTLELLLQVQWQLAFARLDQYFR